MKPTIQEAQAVLNRARDWQTECEKEVLKLVDALKYARERLLDQKQIAREYEDELREACARAERNREAKARRACKALAAHYNITIEIDREFDRTTHYVGQPDWLQGDDPIEDDHYGYCWSETIEIVKFYAKHHPTHPEHATREFHWTAPHI